MEDFFSLVVVVAVFAGITMLVLRINPYYRGDPRQGVLVSYSPSECIEMATAHMARAGYSIAYVGQRSATYTRPKKPNTDIGILLLLLGIIPGLLYFGLFRGTLTSTVFASPIKDGTHLIFSGDDDKAQRELFDWACENLAT